MLHHNLYRKRVGILHLPFTTPDELHALMSRTISIWLEQDRYISEMFTIVPDGRRELSLNVLSEPLRDIRSPALSGVFADLGAHTAALALTGALLLRSHMPGQRPPEVPTELMLFTAYSGHPTLFSFWEIDITDDGAVISSRACPSPSIILDSPHWRRTFGQPDVSAKLTSARKQIGFVGAG